MGELIDGKKLAVKIYDRIVKDIMAANKDCPTCPSRRPNLAIVLIGEREDSLLYVDMKEKEAKKVGIDTHIYRCAQNTEEREIFEIIELLNKDKLIDAILVQLPLPPDFDTDGIIRAINPEKDVDRFHPDNLEKLFKSCRHQSVIPPVHGAVLHILDEIQFETKNKKAYLVVNSVIFGKSLAKVLECRGMEVKTINYKKDVIKDSDQADLVVTAVGKPGIIKDGMIKEKAVVIDIGIFKKGKKVKGDVDLENVKNKAGFISPVPGGVGPLTIAMLFRNTVELFKRNNKIEK